MCGLSTRPSLPKSTMIRWIPANRTWRSGLPRLFSVCSWTLPSAHCRSSTHERRLVQTKAAVRFRGQMRLRAIRILSIGGGGIRQRWRESPFPWDLAETTWDSSAIENAISASYHQSGVRLPDSARGKCQSYGCPPVCHYAKEHACVGQLCPSRFTRYALPERCQGIPLGGHPSIKKMRASLGLEILPHRSSGNVNSKVLAFRKFGGPGT